MNPHNIHSLMMFVNMYRWQMVIFTFVLFIAPTLIAVLITATRKVEFSKACAIVNVTMSVGVTVVAVILAFSGTDVAGDSIHTFDAPRRTAYAAPIDYQPSENPPVHRPAHRAKSKGKCDKDGAIGRIICRNI